jgi:hypothetical protein
MLAKTMTLQKNIQILQKLVSTCDGYAKDVGIVIPQSGNVSTANTTTEEVAPT